MANKTLTRKDLDSMIQEMTEIQQKVKAQAGTATALFNQARLVTLDNEVVENGDLASFASEMDGVRTLGDLAQLTESLQEWAKQASDEAVQAHLKANKPDDTEVTKLRDRFAELRDVVNSAVKLAPLLGIDTEGIVVPDLRGTGGGRPPGTGKSKGVSVKHFTYGRTINGVDTPQSDGQDSQSSMKFYYWKQFFSEKPSMDEWRNMIRERTGVKNPDMDPWEITDDKGVVYWGRVVPEAQPEG